MPSDPPVLMVTGHRPHGIVPGGSYLDRHRAASWAREQIRYGLGEIRKIVPDVVGLSGMALGVDQWFAEAALEVGIPLWAAVPFVGQEDQWSERDQHHYRDLVERAWKVDTLWSVRPRGRRSAVSLLLDRNRWMVQRSRWALAVWHGGQGGGTAHAVRELRRRRVNTVILDPVARKGRALLFDSEESTRTNGEDALPGD